MPVTGIFSPRFRLFIYGSLVLHSAVLLAWQTPMLLSGQKEHVLSVSMMQENSRTKHSEALAEKRTVGTRFPSPATTSRRESHAGENSTEDGVTTVVPNTSDFRYHPTKKQKLSKQRMAKARVSVSTPAAAPASGQSDDQRNAQAQIRSQLQTQLSRYFYYPHLARVRGWEGKVVLGFRLITDGQLENIRIARSSGFAILDASALHSLQRVGQLSEATMWLNSYNMDMHIPIVYKLEERR